MPNTKYRADRIAIPPGSRLYLYSDGAFEVELPDGEMLFTEGLQDIISRVSKHDGPQTAEILRLIREAQGKTEFKDDVSLLELAFD